MADRVRIISSVDAFIKHLSVGDEFWIMDSYLDKPLGIQGPLTLLLLEQDETDAWRFRCRNEETEHTTSERHSDYVSDAVNRYHGVFLSEEDAQSYYEERAEAYETDPVLIAEAEVTAELARLEDDKWDQVYDCSS